jgi:hypothetical protein
MGLLPPTFRRLVKPTYVMLRPSFESGTQIILLLDKQGVSAPPNPSHVEVEVEVEIHSVKGRVLHEYLQ